MSPDTTPDDSIAAWLSAPELDALVARVESRLTPERMCEDCHTRPASGISPVFTRQHGDRWLCSGCRMGY